jgi:hypothetical protein
MRMGNPQGIRVNLPINVSGVVQGYGNHTNRLWSHHPRARNDRFDLTLCFGAGLLARRSSVRHLSEAFEEQQRLLFPRYAVIIEGMANSIGDDIPSSRMRTVRIEFDDWMRVEIDRCRKTVKGLEPSFNGFNDSGSPCSRLHRPARVSSIASLQSSRNRGQN